MFFSGLGKAFIPLISSAFRRNWSRNSCIPEQKIRVNGTDINYVKFGHGPCSVICLPGALGSIFSDFGPILESLNQDLFTVVAWDPPGYGNSRPPDRSFGVNFLEKDAVLVHDLMISLGIKQFSLLGWSDGGITGLILAGRYPEVIKKGVVWGAQSFVTDEDIALYERIRDVSTWASGARKSYLALYDENYFQKTWSASCDNFQDILKSRKGNICDDFLPLIKCPFLIIQGDKDALVPVSHAHHLRKNIKDSKLVIMEGGNHALHLKFKDKFLNLVNGFLLK